jgi:hypothetical protein
MLVGLLAFFYLYPNLQMEFRGWVLVD